jgi:FAD/FMN-containing dehydrogenase
MASMPKLPPAPPGPAWPRDWRRHFGDAWDFLVRSKQRFDPDHVLTPGQGMFRH